MLNVLVLQHAAGETAGTFGEVFAARGVTARVIRGFAGEPVPRSLEGAAGLLVLGGPMGVYEAERYPFLCDELRLIEHALAVGRPIVGICLGSQLLATALGARVAPGPAPEIGWHPVALHDDAASDPLWREAPRAFTALHWHGDVFDLPPQAVALAASAQTPVQAFRHGSAAWGVLFHAEITAPLLAVMMDASPDELRAAGVAAADLLSGARQHLPALTAIGAQVAARFLDVALADTL
jgi:GMP synthase (glutamine-hydrolysing)